MGTLARRIWRRKPNCNLTYDRPANPPDGRTAYEAANGRPATIRDSVVREPLWGASASTYDGSHISPDARAVLDKFSDDIADRIRRKANTEPAVKNEKGNPWVPWDANV